MPKSNQHNHSGYRSEGGYMSNVCTLLDLSQTKIISLVTLNLFIYINSLNSNVT